MRPRGSALVRVFAVGCVAAAAWTTTGNLAVAIATSLARVAWLPWPGRGALVAGVAVAIALASARPVSLACPVRAGLRPRASWPWA